MSSKPRPDATPADVTGAAGRSTIPAAPDDTSAPLVELPRNERRYAIVGEHKAGGQGRILEAEDRWLHRRVALKAPLGLSSGSEARFVREAMVTARMQHPAIVPVYDAGRDAQGRPFFAMKMVHGHSLRDVIAKRRTLDERLALLPNVIAVVEAIAYAHSQGVIHRDLKPSNVLIGPFGETVVIDWGLAKTLDEPDDVVDQESDTDPVASRSSSDLTRQGDIVGTPQYMAPEQAAGQAADERADVYALGAMLYELLSGDAPYPIDSGKVLEAVVAGPPAPIGKKQPGVPEDLAAIVDRAMARRREERYPTAAQLVDDLQRFQTGRLLASRRYSAWQRAQRFIAKHRALVAFLILLVATIAIAGWRVVGERNRARDARDLLLLAQARQAMTRDPTLALAWLRRYPKDGAHAAEARALAMDAVARGVAWRVWPYEEDHELRARFSPTGKLFVVNGEGRLHLFDVERGHKSPPYPVPDGKYFAFDHEGQPALAKSLVDRFYDPWPGQGERRSNVTQCADGETEAVSDDDRWTACGLPDYGVELRYQGMRRELLGHLRTPAALDFSRDGKWLGSASGREVRIWRVTPSGAPVANELARAIDLSPDGRTLAIERESHGLALLDLASGKPRGDCSAVTGVRRLAWSPDSQKLAAATESGLRLLDGASCRAIQTDTGEVVDLAWDARGTRLATVAKAGGLKLWQGGESTQRAGQYAVAFAPDGNHLATGGDLDVHLVDLGGGPERPLRWHRQPIQQVAFGAAGTLASSALDGLVLWDAAGRPTVLAVENARAFEFSPDGRWLAAAFDGAVRLYDTRAPQGWPLVGLVGRADHVHFSLDGAQIGVVADDGAVRVWEVQSRRLIAVFRQQPPVRDLAFLPGGALIAAGRDGLRRFALTDAQTAPDDPAALAGWIDNYTSATLETLLPEAPIDLEDSR